MGRTAVPRASVAPLLACSDSMRPIPASRFQLMPQLGWASASSRSALRYAASAIDGILSAPGEFTTTAGGGADNEAAATWKVAGGRVTSMTDGSEMSPGFTTAAIGLTLASCVGGCTTAGGRGAAA